MNEQQMWLLALLGLAWLYYTQGDKIAVADAGSVGAGLTTGGGTVSTDNTPAAGYGLPGWQSLNSSFYTGE